MLEVQDVRKTFQAGTPSEQRALRGVSLQLQDGEFACIIGSNGAGKSTLFNAIGGTFLVDSGRIRLDGEDITYQKEHRRARNIGRLFQDPKMGTAPGLTIAENLALVHSKATGRFALARGMTRTDREAFRTILSRLEMGLEDRLDVKVGSLSGGQRQALTLLTATMVPPKLLLLDEHTAALDPLTAQKVMELTKQVTKEAGITTLMITHNIGQALKTGNRTLMMADGQLVMDLSGPERDSMTTEDLMKRYRSLVHADLDNDRMLLSEEKA